MAIITFSAWPGTHWVSLAELLVRLGGDGLELTWDVTIDSSGESAQEPALIEAAGRGERLETLNLLGLCAPDYQAVDATFTGYRGGDQVIVLTAVDGTSWDVQTQDQDVIKEFRRVYGAVDVPQAR